MHNIIAWQKRRPADTNDEMSECIRKATRPNVVENDACDITYLLFTYNIMLLLFYFTNFVCVTLLRFYCSTVYLILIAILFTCI